MRWQLLHHACWDGDAKEVERLLAAGADPNQVAPTHWRQTPIGRTLEFRITFPKHSGHVAVVRALLRAGADPAVRSTYLDMTPYELACFCGLEPAVEMLREFQPAAPPHPSGMTPLWLAAASRMPEPAALDEVRRLTASAYLNLVWRKATPLMMATAHAGHFQVADLLLASGAGLNFGGSILHACCEWHFEHLIPALAYLAGHGWTLNAPDAEGQTALHKAALLGYAAIVRKLLALGADPTARDAAGLTPLDIAHRFNKPAAARALTL